MLGNVTGPITLVDATAISSTNSVTSTAIQLDYLSFIAIVLTTTSTATGSAKLQVSIDGSTWVDAANSGNTANKTISGAGSQYWDVPNVSVRYMRVVYTNATNSGTLTIKAYAKGRV